MPLSISKTLAVRLKKGASYLFLLFAIVLGMALVIGFYYNSKNNSPIFVTIQDHLITPNQTLTVFIDSDRHKNSQTLIKTFNHHKPHIAVDVIDKTTYHKQLKTTDVILGDPAVKALDAFDYAIVKPDTTLIGYINGDNPASITFRDFLLSSTAQDLFVEDGLDTIEPYRDNNPAVIDGNTNNTSTQPNLTIMPNDINFKQQ